MIQELVKALLSHFIFSKYIVRPIEMNLWFCSAGRRPLVTVRSWFLCPVNTKKNQAAVTGCCVLTSHGFLRAGMHQGLDGMSFRGPASVPRVSALT